MECQALLIEATDQLPALATAQLREPFDKLAGRGQPLLGDCRLLVNADHAHGIFIDPPGCLERCLQHILIKILATTKHQERPGHHRRQGGNFVDPVCVRLLLQLAQEGPLLPRELCGCVIAPEPALGTGESAAQGQDMHGGLIEQAPEPVSPGFIDSRFLLGGRGRTNGDRMAEKVTALINQPSEMRGLKHEYAAQPDCLDRYLGLVARGRAGCLGPADEPEQLVNTPVALGACGQSLHSANAESEATVALDEHFGRVRRCWPVYHEARLHERLVFDRLGADFHGLVQLLLRESGIVSVLGFGGGQLAQISLGNAGSGVQEHCEVDLRGAEFIGSQKERVLAGLEGAEQFGDRHVQQDVSSHAYKVDTRCSAIDRGHTEHERVTGNVRQGSPDKCQGRVRSEIVGRRPGLKAEGIVRTVS